ncbi:MAG: insulinase family protein [Chitinophagaceae bacterium]
MVQENLSKVEQQRSDPYAISNKELPRIVQPYPKGHVFYTKNFDEQVAAFKAVRLSDVKSLYADLYNGDSASVAVVGDCDKSATIQQLGKILQNWKSPKPFVRIPEHDFPIAFTEKQINTPDKKNAYYLVGMNLPVRDDSKDYPALDIGNYILGGGFLNSRLVTRVRQKDGLSYGVGSYNSNNAFDSTCFFGMYAIYNPDNVGKLDSAIKEEISKMLKDGITEEELKVAKSGYLQTREVTRAEEANLATKMNRNLRLNRKLSFDAAREKVISELTVEQVNAALREYIKPEKFVTIKAGDFDRVKPEIML